jgi:hypothetical protein
MESGPTLWLLLLTIGVVALGLAIGYGISQNQKRTAAEKALTEAATQREYQQEDRDRS